MSAAAMFAWACYSYTVPVFPGVAAYLLCPAFGKDVFKQIIGCFLVNYGVILAVASGANEGQLLFGVKLIWPALMVASSAFQAGASILKESVFIDGAKRLKGKRPDIFVVNSFGSGFQPYFVFLLLPVLSNLRGIKFAELPAYLNGGTECFLNAGESPIDCGGAPFLPLLFMLVSMAFNISLLNLVKMSSALVAWLTSTSAVSISIYILSLPLPYIPQGAKLSGSFMVGTMVLLMGLILYSPIIQRVKDWLKLYGDKSCTALLL